MRILGVDPGLKATGYGVVDVRAKHLQQVELLETGTIEPEQKGDFQNRIIKIHKNLDDVINQYSPQVMVLEKLYSHYRHPTTACILGHVRGVICLLSAQHQLQLVEHSVKRIRKALVGNGSATKQQTRSTVAHILKIDAQKLTLDASDALALALGYAAMTY
ncbi:MAG: crossover junction endodeoxyribonuclease RuvC [Candidatus Omnitrophica bacterium]|nr:crossover junction endodeoxyribonuclease RuvC [Candidatus Omnitrophota bacterium]